MDFVPQYLVIGLYTPPPGSPGVPALSMDMLNRIWAEVTSVYDYRMLQVSPDRTAGVFAGASDRDGVTIQPPLLQVRVPVELSYEKAADKGYDILSIISRHLGVTQFYNLGIRQILHGVVPDQDTRALIVHRLMGKSEEDLGDLDAGGQLQAGLRFFVSRVDGAMYTLIIEPLFADPRLLYVDLDAQFGGPLPDLEAVRQRAAEAGEYISTAVNSFLNRFL